MGELNTFTDVFFLREILPAGDVFRLQALQLNLLCLGDKEAPTAQRAQDAGHALPEARGREEAPCVWTLAKRDGGYVCLMEALWGGSRNAPAHSKTDCG
jgi:hypothetical protein